MPNDTTLLISQEITFKKYFLSSLGANVAAFSIGTVLGTLNSLNQSTKIHLEPYQQSWFSFLIPLAAIVGCLISVVVVEKFGRKFTLFISSIPMLIGWLVICYAQDITALFIGRFITGCALGMCNVAAPIYIAETATPKTRGLLGSSFYLAISLGILFSYVIGLAENSSYLAFYCSIVPAIQMIFMFFLPETPAWLIRHGKVDIATETVISLYGNDHNLLTLALFTDDDESSNSSKDMFRLFKEARFRSPFVLCLIMMFFQQFSGITIVLFYITNSFESANSSINTNHLSIIIGLVQIIIVAINCLIVDRIGRKILLYVSGFFMGISMMLLTSYHLIIDDASKKHYGSWPAISLIIFIFAFSIAYGPVPWLLMSELVSTKVKGLASGLITSFNFICMFITAYGFQMAADLIDFKFIYLAFSLISFSSIFFVYHFLPETKGESLIEIEEYFVRRTLNEEQNS